MGMGVGRFPREVSVWLLSPSTVTVTPRHTRAAVHSRPPLLRTRGPWTPAGPSLRRGMRGIQTRVGLSPPKQTY